MLGKCNAKLLPMSFSQLSQERQLSQTRESSRYGLTVITRGYLYVQSYVNFNEAITSIYTLTCIN